MSYIGDEQPIPPFAWNGSDAAHSGLRERLSAASRG